MATKAIWSALPEYELCAQLFFHPTHTNRRLHLDAKGIAGTVNTACGGRGTRHEPLLLKLFPPEIRPRQREVLIESYRNGKIAEAFRAFKKIYLEIVDEVLDSLRSQRLGIPLLQAVNPPRQDTTRQLLPRVPACAFSWLRFLEATSLNLPVSSRNRIHSVAHPG